MLGQGGNAAVYRATIPEKEITVALKRPFPDRTVESTTIERILSEAKRWAKIDDHPYVANVINWGSAELPWVAIEYLDGGTLAERLDSLSLPQRLWTAYALVDALAYASGQCGVTHHDLKPQNILFKELPGEMWDVPKICDWGLGRELIQHDGSISQATPEYAAPEQFAALMPETDVGVHTDVYQLGVVCYELLTGEHPNHLGGDVAPPSKVNATVPEVVDDILMQAIAHERQNRYDHPLQFQDALADVVHQPEEALDVTPTTPEPDAWPMFQADPARVGHSSGVSGPKQSVTERWEFSVGYDDIESSPAVVDGTVYITSDSGAVYAINSDDGTEKWNLSERGSMSSPAVDDGMVYIGDYYGNIRALGTNYGIQWWSCEISDSVGGPAVVDDTIYVCSDDEHVYAIDTADGTVRWAFETDYRVRSPPAVAGDTVYFGSNDNSFYSVDASDGSKNWSIETGSQIQTAPAVAENTVYFGNDGGYMYALDAADGTVRWQIKTHDSIQSSPAVADGTVYFGSHDHRVYALDATDATPEWVVETDGEIQSSPTVADDTVYVGNNRGKIYAIGTGDGTFHWTYETDGEIHGSPAVVDDTVYIGNNSGNVYALWEG